MHIIIILILRECLLKNMKNIKASFLWCKEKEQGLSLIEVMLSSLILSFGLLGFLQGQLMALRVSEQAYFINLADLKNGELAERVRSCSNTLPCIHEQLNFWQEEIKTLFPKGENSSATSGADYQIKISWISTYQPKLQSLYLLFRL